jgi:hypothetical protein
MTVKTVRGQQNPPLPLRARALSDERLHYIELMKECARLSSEKASALRSSGSWLWSPSRDMDTTPVVLAERLQRQHAVSDFIPGPKNGQGWAARAMRMIEESIPDICYLKTYKDGHANIMVNNLRTNKKRHVFLRLDNKEDGVYMSTYQMTRPNEEYLGEIGLRLYTDMIRSLSDSWHIPTSGRGTGKRRDGGLTLRPRSIKVTGMSPKDMYDRVERFAYIC